MPVSAKTTVQSTSRSAIAVLRDIYYLKLSAVEVICQLALDTIATIPGDSVLFAQLVEQVREEFDHLDRCRRCLWDHAALETPPDYARRFTRVMHSYAKNRSRTLPLAAAALLCIAVERSAMRQLTRAPATNPEIADLLSKLGADEEDHYKLVAEVVGPCASSNASVLERIRTYRMMLRVTWIALASWWPHRVADYRSMGLNAEVFVEDVMDYSENAFRSLKLFFPRRILSRLAKMSVRAAWSRT